MFARAIDAFLEKIGHFKIFVIVADNESGIVLRLGRYHRTIGPGLRWLIPIVEQEMMAHTGITTTELRPQSITTKDDKQVVISLIVKYRIHDPRLFLLTVWDSADVLKDVTMGAAKQIVNEHTWDQLRTVDVASKVQQVVRREVVKYGFKILRVTFSDMARIRSMRIMQTNEGHHKQEYTF